MLRMKNLLLGVQVVVKTINLTISRCRLADDIKEVNAVVVQSHPRYARDCMSVDCRVTAA